jgi:BirA family biotin operon repressor/biotin-[acetyl-CoA-carboxylase] ligase
LIAPGITHLAEVGSTNDWLLERVGDLPDGHWVITDRQTAGRGRRGRAWGDGAGNLMASVLVRADGPVQQLSFVAAVALATALASPLPLAGGVGASLATGARSDGEDEPTDPSREQQGRLSLKWPNDLLLDGRKVSGILLERAGTALVIGFGVNIASFPQATERPAISLAAAGLPTPAPIDLLARLATAFAEYRALWAGQGFAPIRNRWLAQAAGLGDRIIVRLGDDPLEGVFEGLDPDGALSLRLDDGRRRAIHAGEVFAL